LEQVNLGEPAPKSFPEPIVVEAWKETKHAKIQERRQMLLIMAWCFRLHNTHHAFSELGLSVTETSFKFSVKPLSLFFILLLMPIAFVNWQVNFQVSLQDKFLASSAPSFLS